MSTPKKPAMAAAGAQSKPATLQRRSWLHRARKAVAGLLGVGLVTAASSAAAQAPVPQHWIAYAQLASGQLQGWLGDETNEPALRLQEWGQKRLSGSGAAAAGNSIVVRLWVDAGGRVERAEFTSLGDDQADADLRRVLTAQAISEPPPKDMLQPMVLGLTLALPADTPPEAPK
ncbi:YbaB/EbfC family DNA-binding protein [Pollutimonas bauzanensis]|uniref:TonB family C-terminal domain-containing protein n=1 Tax=Pollutimonas bauzanensis TaxID=658167 RepID=A0A1M5ZM30_9BURK|nr:YbaB/EbfC family DNA-binding protein [Pollutimonas bauzanensis]SHI25231.1 hypothetical protein SAMN04488135_1168 [Pollutimonas bauzanensis]